MYPVHSNCLLCNSTKLVELPQYAKDYLVKCKSCQFVFCKRIPSQEELINHYKTYQRGNAISAITLTRYEELLSEFEKFRKTNNILDVGCGDGYFLEVAKKRGWNVYGTEFSDEAVALLKTKNIHVNQGQLKASNYQAEMFDVITSFEVIEHINNPQEELTAFHHILRKKGLVYMTTPNFNSISRRYLKHWNVIEYPEHLCYYTSTTLTKLMSKFEFEKSKTITTGIDINRIRNSNKPSTNASNSNFQENFREKSESNGLFGLIKKAINTFLNTFKIGDALKGYYFKK